MGVIRDTNDFEVRFQFRKMGFFHLKSINIIGIFDILLNDKKVGLLRHFVCYNRNAQGVGLNVVN